MRYSDVTPKSVYISRRKLLAAGAALAGAGSLPLRAGTKLEPAVRGHFSTSEKQTPFEAVSHYNNFYEFGSGKEQPAMLAQRMRTRPWTVSVEGAVKTPKTYDIDAIMRMAPLEERIYRHRCVEAWSIVVPWIGIPLNVLIKQVEPTSNARFVAFQSFYDAAQMPAARWAGIPFPYVEGLRLDEAMNPLTLLAFGMYGEVLPNQDGAPVRLVVPWKYGFKSIKSIVKIRFEEKQPPTTWNLANAREYGFYSNVNPRVDHPRWSQSSERRLGDLFRRDTLLFNGYGEQVAGLYTGMDLSRDF